ncbi:MAG: TonB-dependent receptor [Sphingomonas sp.]|uniref:TonB-dependent receptor n=1 Tax=Sphingomonas sp. TaxID=28214 RepID=UPI001B142BF8|nr:TonB-dependent receptor [Sphingomonas sp.]MBO9623967.1 TonB-dependent receptor [Sphingomonas sp.]
MSFIRKTALLASISTAPAVLLFAPVAALAQQAARHAYDLPSQPLAAALRSVAAMSGRSIVAPAELLRERIAPPLKGEFTVEEAVTALLVGSGLRYRAIDDGFVIEGVEPARQPDLAAEAEPIVVTGSRIRGAVVASPVVSVSEAAIRDAGQSDLGEVARSIPQSFGGGQNPGVGFNVPSSTGGNVGGGASFNLRGLGSDATLTLLNGRRMPYDSARQGIDISAIPLAAVERIEVVADGASALYGSDAVGGVVNVLLKRDFEGIETRARLGGSTDGGNVQQQYGALFGGRWAGGGAFLAYDYSDNSLIRAADRDYAAARPGITLLPGSARHAVAASGHQSLGDGLSIQIDALYSERSSRILYPLNFAGDLAVSRTEQSFRSDSHAVALELGWTRQPWRFALTGTLGGSLTRFRGDSFVNDRFASTAGGRYDNRSRSVELAADGPLFALPGGAARVAMGVGARANDFALFRGTGAPQNIDARQRVLYAYGEVELPIVSPEQELGWAHRLNLSGAVRYERYAGIDAVVTPKFGLVYSPDKAVTLKASWGRSFRAPSFIQQYQVQQALLYPVTTFGGTGYPAGSTALLLVGGNPDLRPERAQSLSATAVLEPAALPGARLELGYFSTRYVDRIVNPIPLLSQALANPIYRDRISFNPSPAMQAALLAVADQFVNGTGTAYDPAKVVAVANGANVNAGRQSIRGVDALLGYRADIGADTLEFGLNATYLVSDQRLAPAQPVQPLAGTLFNPPHWRGRGTLAWEHGALRLAGTLSHIGGVTDPRQTPAEWVAGMTSFDLTARYRVPGHVVALGGTELTLTVQNLFNDTPDTIATSVYYDTPYDSTNYAAVGRFVALGLSRKW